MVGLPKSIIKKYGISKKAWRVFRAQKGKANKPKNPSKKASSGGGKTGKRWFGVSGLFKFIKIGAFLAPAGHAYLSRDNNRDRLSYGLEKYTGYNMNGGYFRWESLMEGWLPYVATTLITTGVQKLNGIIRRL